DPRGLTETLASAASDIQLGAPFQDFATVCCKVPLVLATGGFAAKMARTYEVPLRANRWSEGDGIAFAMDRGASMTYGGGLYARAMPDTVVAEDDYVRLSQVYGRYA